MKKFKMTHGFAVRKFDYNGQIWLTDGHALVDARFVSLGRKKVDSVVCEKTEGSHIDMILRSYDIVQYGTRLYYLSQEEVNQVFQVAKSPSSGTATVPLDTEFNRLKICFVDKDNSNPLFIDGDFYSWFADVGKEKDFGLYSTGDCYNPIFLVNHKEKQVIGCLMPLRY